MTESEYEERGACPRCQGAGSLWTWEGEADCPRCGGSGEWAPEPETFDLGPEPVAEKGWHLYDHAGLVEKITSGDWMRPTPTIGTLALMTESARAPKALFYEGRVNSIYGTPDCAKTFTCLVATRQVLAEGGAVLFIDFEDTAEGIYPKLLADLGVPAADLGRFLYVVPTRAMAPEDGNLLRDLLDKHRPALVIVDSTGEGMALDQKNQNSDPEVATWMREVPTMMANHAVGPAVVLIDHLPKADTKGSTVRFPIGSQRKQAVVRGASYHQEVAQPFSRQQGGYARLTCTKDKGGTYAHDQEVAHLLVTLLAPPTSESDGMTAWDLVSVDPDEARERSEASVRQAIIAVLVDQGGTMIQGDIVAGVEARIEVPRGTRPSDVLKMLVTEGVVLARKCGKNCEDRCHTDPKNKRNTNKTHYALPFGEG